MKLFEKAVIETMKNLKIEVANDNERNEIIQVIKNNLEEQGCKSDWLFNLIDENSWSCSDSEMPWIEIVKQSKRLLFFWSLWERSAFDIESIDSYSLTLFMRPFMEV